MYKVLIVDDEEEIRSGYARFFPWEEQGFQVAGTAADGIQALEFLAAQPVDVVLCDIVMPRMDGLTLTGRIVSDYPEVVVIILSDHQNFEYARRAMQHNISHYVLKSDKHAVLLDVLVQIRKQLDNQAETGGRGVVETVRKHVREHLSTANLQSAAEATHINQHYLSRLFKERTGENFYAYLLRIKMERARELLVRPGVKVADVSEELGYSDPKNFNRIFKKLTGMSPRDYRKAGDEAAARYKSTDGM